MGLEKRITFTVLGMSCASCSAAVERALNRAEGVSQATVNLATEKATVTYDVTKTNPAALQALVRESGYDVRFERREFHITGMT